MPVDGRYRGRLMGDNRSYGTTKSGLEITDELIEQYVEEAERGYDLDKLRPRHGRDSEAGDGDGL